MSLSHYSQFLVCGPKRQVKEPSHPYFVECLNTPVAILSSIKRYVLSNLFPSKPPLVSSAQKPFNSQPNYSW